MQNEILKKEMDGLMKKAEDLLSSEEGRRDLDEALKKAHETSERLIKESMITQEVLNIRMTI
jgi:hypothetical protein